MQKKQARIIDIGNQSFAELRQDNSFYIDKTDFIRQWWDDRNKITLIARPRRFGKTLNINMLESFFSVEYKGRSDLFEGLEIWKHENFRKLQGTIPVISLTFSDAKFDSFDMTMEHINSLLASLYTKFSYLYSEAIVNDIERDDFKSISPYMNQALAVRSLRNLCILLERYYCTAPIVLLDEYDAPMQEAWAHGYWDEMCSFMRSFMNATFKSNPALGRGLLTGVTCVSKESIFSGLNNINVVTTMSDEYETSFGFTQNEVFAALDEMHMSDKRDEAKVWYDGFRFGKIEGIYNPWSVICYLDKRKPQLYWANSANNDLVDELIKEGDKDLKEDMLSLLKGEPIEVSYNDQIDFRHLSDTPDAVWNLLLATGYLRIAKAPTNLDKVGLDRTLCLMKLTNLETRELFETLVRGWFKTSNIRVQYNEFVKCLLVSDIKGMQRFLNKIALRAFSFFDVGSKDGSVQDDDGVSAPERFYHGFVLGLLVDLSDKYEITSNRESGYGRYDVMLKPLNDTDPAYVFEFKVLDKDEDEDTLEDTLQAAKDQIKERSYAASLEDAGIEKERIHELGIAFQGKKCIIG